MRKLRLIYDIFHHHIVSENSKEQIKLEHMPEKHRIVAAKRLKYPTKESILDEAMKYGVGDH